MQTVYNVEQKPLGGNNIQLPRHEGHLGTASQGHLHPDQPLPTRPPVKPIPIEIDFPAGHSGRNWTAEETAPVQIIEELNKIGGPARRSGRLRRGRKKPESAASKTRGDLRVAPRRAILLMAHRALESITPGARGAALQGVAVPALTRTWVY